MNEWILAQNGINFAMAAGLFRLRMPGVSCVTKANACHHTLHAIHWHCLWKIPPIIAVKSNVTTSIEDHRFVVNIYCTVAFTVFKHADIKAFLEDGYCEGHHVTTRSAWNGSRLEHICAFYMEITSIHGVKLKMSFAIYTRYRIDI